MRRTDKEMTDRAEIDTVIRGSEVCRLAFAVHNEPYMVPMSFGYDGGHLYFHTARSGKKIDCIEANNRVCFELERGVELVENDRRACDWTFAFESVIGFGTITEVVEPDEKTIALNHIMEHHSGRRWELGSDEVNGVRVWRLAVESMTGKRSRFKDA
jgi:nitroimidazol reductase NimA-like FMN-containing flavoprotein (pyridoxamine 5'-phosphate oxidase superfamily)